MPEIACVYCGGSHPDPAQVRACWERSESAPSLDVGDPPRPTVAEPAHERSPRTPSRLIPATSPTMSPPAALGRHVVVVPGADVPPGWAEAPRLVIDDEVLADPAAAVGQLRSAVTERRSLVIELAVEAHRVPRLASVVEPRPAHELGPRFTPLLDDLGWLTWANSIDATAEGAHRWWLLDQAVALGAEPGARADLRLPGGDECWLDGGVPRVRPAIDGIGVLPGVSVEHGSLEMPVVDAPTPSAGELAPDQLAAVTHVGGAARIIAPAGSGKTRVLTERARHMVERWRVPASAVTLVAFNRRAQREMAERTTDVPGLEVRTLNSIALAIVNGTAPFASRPSRVSTIDEGDVRRLLGRMISFPKRRNTDPVAPWIEALGAIRLGLRPPADVERDAAGEVDGLADLWPAYLSALDASGAVDFDGQIHRAIEILLTDPVAREAARRACRVMLVDEFQDLTPAHLLLVRLLAGPPGATYAVGDDDQTIYGYNGATPDWLIDFEALFPGAGDHPLEVNYRCPPVVVDAADRLLRHNRRRVAKTIRARPGRPHEPDERRTITSDDAVSDTVGIVRDAIERGVPPREVAVLTRVNSVLAPVQVALSTEQLPLAGGIGTEFADRTAIRAALSWLRLGVGGAPFEPDDLTEVLRRPSRSLHPRIAEWVTEQRDLEALRRLAGRLTNERDAERVASLADDLASLRRLIEADAPLARTMTHLVDDIGLGGAVASLDTTRRGTNRAAQGDDLVALIQLARRFDREHHGSAAGRFESWLRRHLAVPRSADGVVLATVHRVKGQEWPHVVVHLAAGDQYPHRLADDVEEERRLFHVAMTRASGRCTIVTGDRPSPFVAELDTEPPAELPAAEPRPATPEARPSRARHESATDPLVERGVVWAVPGLVLVDQGISWEVEHVDGSDAVAVSGDVTRRFALGGEVATRGRRRGALRAPSDDLDPIAVLLVDDLRAFRDRARDGKPAYTVFDDATMAAIATARPATQRALGRVKGIGPAKLDRFGDEVVEIISARSEGS